MELTSYFKSFQIFLPLSIFFPPLPSYALKAFSSTHTHSYTLQHKLLFATQILYLNNTQQTNMYTYLRTPASRTQRVQNTSPSAHAFAPHAISKCTTRKRRNTQMQKRESPSPLTISEA
jgi:hypothetical protein